MLNVVATVILARQTKFSSPSLSLNSLLKATMAVSLALPLSCHWLENSLPSTDSPTWLTEINIERQCSLPLRTFVERHKKDRKKERWWWEELVIWNKIYVDTLLGLADNAGVWHYFACAVRIMSSSRKKFSLKVCVSNWPVIFEPSMSDMLAGVCFVLQYLSGPWTIRKIGLGK